MDVLLKIQNVSLSYQSHGEETAALDGISLSIRRGEWISLLGPSGCGKSTLLSVIAGLEKPSSGSLTFAAGAGAVGYMFQHDLLLEWRTVLQNACLGLEIRRQLTPASINRIRQMLSSYGLGDYLDRHPSELSGGMRQRVALVRTLALHPDLLLLDEPYSALDYPTRLTVSDEIWQLLHREKHTAVLVTHDIAEAISLGDRVLLLSARPGRILRDISLHFDGDRRPLAVREDPLFQQYYHEIWEVMQHEL